MTPTQIAMKQAALRVLDEHGERLPSHVLDEVVAAQFEACRAANVERITKLMQAEADPRIAAINQVVAL